MHCEGSPHLLFTDNDTNTTRLFGAPGPQYAKDDINEAVVHGREDAVNPRREGTKTAARYGFVVGPGEHVRVRLRLSDKPADEWAGGPFTSEFDATVVLRAHVAAAERESQLDVTKDANQPT